MRSSTSSSPNMEEDASVWTETSRSTNYTGRNTEDDHSYYTHYSEGSMGLAKRTNKQLSLVSYVAMAEDASDSNNEDYSFDALPEVQNESSGESSHFRRKMLPKQSKDSSHERSFDNSTSTRARGNTKKYRSRHELEVINDTDEERDESNSSPVKKRPVAEDLTREAEEDDTFVDGAETRSRRRERLTRSSGVKSSSRGKEDVSGSGRNKKTSDPDSVPVRERSASPRKQSSKSSLKTPKYSSQHSSSPTKERKRSKSSSRRRSTKKDDDEANNERSSEHARDSSSKSSKRDASSSKHSKKVSTVKHSRSPGRHAVSSRNLDDHEDSAHERNAYHYETEEHVQAVNAADKRYQEVMNSSKKLEKVQEPAAEARNQAQPSLAQLESNGRLQAVDAADQRYLELMNTPMPASIPSGPARYASPLRLQHQQQLRNTPIVSPRQPRKESEAMTGGVGHYRGDTAFQVTGSRPDRAAFVGRFSTHPDAYTVNSDNSSFVSESVQDNPCAANFSHQNGNAQCHSYKQKCTSFVSGVWESFAGSMRYETESKNNLLQLEMIAEQSVSTIVNGTGPERKTPAAIVHSRELLKKVNDSPSPRGATPNASGFNVEGALASFSTKVQEAVGIAENHMNENQSMIDDMRHLFNSFSVYKTPHHQPYDQAGFGNVPVYHFDHNMMSGGASLASSTEYDEDDETISPNEIPSDLNKMEHRQPTTSIYSTVAKGGQRDRRSMMLELQKRRKKQIQKRKEDEWTEANRRKTEEETAKLRNVYLGLYDKIHEDENAKTSQTEENEATKITSAREEVHDEAEDRFESMDEERDVVWEASEDPNQSTMDLEDESAPTIAADPSEDKQSIKKDCNSNSRSSSDCQEAERVDSELIESLQGNEDSSKPVSSIVEETGLVTSEVDLETKQDVADGNVQPLPTDSADTNDDDMFTAVGSISGGRTRSDSSASGETEGPEDEKFSEANDENEVSSHTNVTTNTFEMDALVHSFLGCGPSQSLQNTLLEAQEGARSSTPLTSLREETEFEQAQEGDDADMALQQRQLGEADNHSTHSGDPTLADSTIVSSYSDSRHKQDMSMADSIYSGSRSTRTGDFSESSQFTPEPSEVPPEIAQPHGPIPEYQVLYQISEEEEENTTESDNDGAFEDGFSYEASFDLPEDIPFDEEAHIDDDQSKPSKGRGFWYARLLRWFSTLAVAYYLGSMGLHFNPATESDVVTVHGKTMVQIVDAKQKLENTRNVDAKEHPSMMEDVDESIWEDDVYADIFDFHPKQSQEDVEIPSFDGLCISDDGEMVCRSDPFVSGETLPKTENEAFRRAWASELHEALRA